jgi:Ca2+-binding RTX toxin-like protein
LAGVLLISLVAGGASASTLTCFGREPSITGSEGPDVLSGTPGSDVIVGLGGNDTISGGGGSDFICGGAGNDTISGGPGRDRLSGEAGADRIEGGSGDDRLLGGPGDDRLDGGEGSDATAGAAGTDTCLGAEAPASCEIFPPSGCSNAARVPATPQTVNVTLLGSNAFQTHSSLGTCFEGHCDYDYLTFVAEVRNDTGSSLRLGRATLKIYDGSGTQIGTRFAYPVADALAPGQRTVLRETAPSLLCMGGETCLFPDGWASWRLVLSGTFGSPSEWDDVVIGSRLSSLAPGSGGGALAEGTATNTRGVPLDSVYSWVVLYDSGGRLINVDSNSEFFFSEELAPGAATPFEVTIDPDEPACFASARVGVAGQ